MVEDDWKKRAYTSLVHVVADAPCDPELRVWAVKLLRDGLAKEVRRGNLSKEFLAEVLRDGLSGTVLYQRLAEVKDGKP